MPLQDLPAGPLSHASEEAADQSESVPGTSPALDDSPIIDSGATSSLIDRPINEFEARMSAVHSSPSLDDRDSM